MEKNSVFNLHCCAFLLMYINELQNKARHLHKT